MPWPSGVIVITDKQSFIRLDLNFTCHVTEPCSPVHTNDVHAHTKYRKSLTGGLVHSPHNCETERLIWGLRCYIAYANDRDTMTFLIQDVLRARQSSLRLWWTLNCGMDSNVGFMLCCCYWFSWRRWLHRLPGTEMICYPAECFGLLLAADCGRSQKWSRWDSGPEYLTSGPLPH